MSRASKAASFDEFLQAPSRLAEREASSARASVNEDTQAKKHKPSPARSAKQSKAASHKEKVGLTIDSAIIDAIDDYIYRERKRGRRLKKNDVYEAALRQFLGLEEDDAR